MLGKIESLLTLVWKLLDCLFIKVLIVLAVVGRNVNGAKLGQDLLKRWVRYTAGPSFHAGIIRRNTKEQWPWHEVTRLQCSLLTMKGNCEQPGDLARLVFKCRLFKTWFPLLGSRQSSLHNFCDKFVQ